jgi:hypothetical protein
VSSSDFSKRRLSSAPPVVLAALAAVALTAALAISAAPASAAGSGYVRLAHLSPDTPAVDVYLRSKSGAVPAKTFPGVAYGALSAYLRLPAGVYSVAMRKAGAAKSSPPVLTTQVTVANGAAYTVAGVGRYADLGLRVLRDDLTLPTGGAAKVRIVQASVRAPVLDVNVDKGARIADNVAFATTTSYRRVNPGTWVLRVEPSGGGTASRLPCTLTGGSVYSVLILDAKAGGLRAQLVRDAGRSGVVPTGGVATGAGGGAGSGWRGGMSGWPGALLLAALAAALTGTVAVALRRRLRRR